MDMVGVMAAYSDPLCVCVCVFVCVYTVYEGAHKQWTAHTHHGQNMLT